MVAFRPLLVLYMVAGITAAGKCRPSGSTITTSETSLTTLLTGTTLTDSATETSTTETATTSTATESLTSSTAETSTETTTESATDSTTGSTTEASTYLTTDTTLTTFMTSTTITTSEPATTTSEAPVVVSCPSTGQCLHTMNIMCDYIIGGIPYDDELSLNECAHKCDNDPSCALFVHDSSSNYCYYATSTDQIRGEGPVPGWASGVKGRCGQ
ncbi:uncharacterized protein NECHADRAFT_89035 [Fusarium vanettenii 77-13-4]|uniref:Apple domain-containing protein n=1 Tax=Fusarium vanettenii (strain ATCC MYA-4622 / CBS 123669 / FGSC 9596 / NRRL 45880 / 77-13-4) TaxID=660122 RepID=C7ZPZ0_FUSV7|nr:uncharacterized protein NECHADRAFT_89035 [Fusarium vanettenii 77-13-4]EEU33928.1 hypothetical protein NECHADRAFT_89035 [Fusarium vanettenii 77-13-4]